MQKKWISLIIQFSNVLGFEISISKLIFCIQVSLFAAGAIIITKN